MRFDKEGNTLTLEWNDILLLTNHHISNYRFYNGRLPNFVTIEIPTQAYYFKTGESCPMMYEVVEPEPPENWLKRAIKPSNEIAPPMQAAEVQPVKPAKPPQEKKNFDEMVAVRGMEQSQVGSDTPRNLGPHKDKKSDIVTLSSKGPLESVTQLSTEEAVAQDAIRQEGMKVLTDPEAATPEPYKVTLPEGDSDNTVLGGQQRTGEHDRITEAITTAEQSDSKTFESDGDE